MKQSSPNRRFLVIAACIALASGTALGLAVNHLSTKQVLANSIPGLLWPAPQALSSFSLHDQFGETFELERLQGKWSFLFFGYTSCPDICPMTMAVLDQVNDLLSAQSTEEQLQFVLVSVDPDRDAPERLRDYVAYFDDSFIGLSGPDANLQELTRQLGIMYIPGAALDGEDYLVDHSASILLIAPNLSLIGVFSAPHDPKDIADRAARIMSFFNAKV